MTSFDVPGADGGPGTQVRGTNPRGDIVGWFRNSGGKRIGFLLSQGEFTFIDLPGTTLTQPLGINPEGDIVGDYASAGNTHGFLLSK
jgi:hypothetical protein